MRRDSHNDEVCAINTNITTENIEIVLLKDTSIETRVSVRFEGRNRQKAMSIPEGQDLYLMPQMTSSWN